MLTAGGGGKHGEGERANRKEERQPDKQTARQTASQTDRKRDREPCVLLLLFSLVLFSCVTLRLEDHGEKRQEVDMQQ